MTTRRTALAALGIAGMGPVGLRSAFAQSSAATYPDKPVKFWVGYAPGGPSDIYTRLLGAQLQELNKGTTWIVENRPGAGGKLAPQAMLQQPADGYNLLFAGQPLLTTIFHKNPGFDAMRDLQVVGSVYTSPFFLAVNATLPVKSVKELVAYTKANPGKINLSAGIVTGEMMGTYLGKSMGMDLTPIRYKGNAPALQALLANEVQVHFDQYATLRPQVEAGKVRILASTADKRSPLAPDVPTFNEQGVPQLTLVSTGTILGHASLPEPIVRKLFTMIRAAVSTPAVAAKYKTDAVEVPTGTLEETRARVQQEYRFWGEAAKAANYVPEA